MAGFCTNCGAAVPPAAAACPNCGKAIAQSSVSGTTGGLSENVAGLLAYVTIIPAIVFLVLEPYNRNRFIRFHSFQNIFFHIAWFVIGAAMGTLAMIPVLGWATTLLIWPLLGLGGLVLWIVLMLKAYQGQMFKLPFIGDLAEKQAGS